MARRLFLVGALLLFPIALLAPPAWAPTGRTIHVDCTNTTGIEDGSEAYPYNTIQEGRHAAVSGDTVLIHPCTYGENIYFLGKAITVTSTDPLDPAVVGATVIDGGGAGSVVTFANGEGPGSVLQGFTIRNGSGNLSGTYRLGGGIYCRYSSPTIRHCWITDNNVPGERNAGGGVYCFESSPSITNCLITRNSAWYGGGLFLQKYMEMLAWQASSEPCAPMITNCTIADNTGHLGSGIRCFEADPTVCNCIVWNNSITGSYFRLDYSDTFEPWPWPGEGNICVDPQFVDAANGDYHLLPTSPCIDVGLNECAPSEDIDGQLRPWPPGGVVDMGADECVLACDCDVAIDRTHCKMPAAGHIGQCKIGQVGARNLSFTESCDVVMRVIDNAGAVVFQSEPIRLGPGCGIRLRFEHCYTADEIGRNLWAWEVWPVDCAERTPWDNVQYRAVNVQPGERSGAANWLPLWWLRRR